MRRVFPVITFVAGLSVGASYHRWVEDGSVLLDTRLPDCPPELIHSSRRILKYGLPSSHNIKYRETYVVDYDRRLRNPSWVAEHLTSAQPVPEAVILEAKGLLARLMAFFQPQSPATLSAPVDRALASFKADLSEPESLRVKPDDLFHTGYDRGHLMPGMS